MNLRLYLLVSFGDQVTVVPATRSNSHKENLQPAGPGQKQSVEEAPSKIQIPGCSKTLQSFYAGLFFLEWGQTG